MNFASEADKGRLVSSWWKNTANVYSSPETYIRGGCVPSLVWFCLQCIFEYPDQIQLPFKLVYRPSAYRPPESFCPLGELLRSATAGPSDRDSSRKQACDLSKLDPRLWATLVQIYNSIPPELRTYTIPLNGEFLPLLQEVQNTDTFSLMTILELPGCSTLTDDSIAELGFLHRLVAFDASRTNISANGILSFARTLRTNDPSETTRKLRGPWGVRILRLKHCKRIGNSVFEAVSKFPLLSVIDLRGTECRPPSAPAELVFSPNKDRALFSSNLSLSLSALQKHEENVKVFSAPPNYQVTLRIKTLCHPTVASALSDAEKRIQSHSPERSPPQVDGEYEDPWSFGDNNPWYWDFESNSDDSEMFCNHHEGTGDNKNEHSRATDREEGEEYEDWRGERLLEEDVWDSEDTGGEQNSAFRQVNKNSFLNEMTSEHILNSSPPESRPSKRRKMIPTIPTQSHELLANHDVNELDSDSDTNVRNHSSPQLLGSLKNVRDRRKPYWYDADWGRENTYVPLSEAKGKHDSELMLYRPMRPWSWLEKELDILIAREIYNKEARAKNNVPLVISITPDNKKGLKARQGLLSMTAAALQRRKMDVSQDEHRQPRKSSSKNPFARQPLVPNCPDGGDVRAQPVPAAQSLKPISSLRVPEFTQELLRDTATKEVGAQDSCDKKNTLTSRRHRLPGPAVTAESLTRGPFGSGARSSTPTNPREEGRKPCNVSASEALPTTSGLIPSNTTNADGATRPKKGKGKKDEKSQPVGFDWAKWASKRS